MEEGAWRNGSVGVVFMVATVGPLRPEVGAVSHCGVGELRRYGWQSEPKPEPWWRSIPLCAKWLVTPISFGSLSLCPRLIHSLFSRMWERREMHDILETDENFEIVASTMKCIYDQTCRKCGSDNRVIFYQLKEGRTQRKLRIEHGKGDTQGYLWHRQKEQKRMGDAPSSRTDKRPREGGSGSGYGDSQWSERGWWNRDYQGDSGSQSSSSWQWRH